MQNEPPFSAGISSHQHAYIPGMTLRDYLAGQVINKLDVYDPAFHRSNAKLAYMQADAMLSEREKSKG
jgi:hypothetical protein